MFFLVFSPGRGFFVRPLFFLLLAGGTRKRRKMVSRARAERNVSMRLIVLVCLGDPDARGVYWATDKLFGALSQERRSRTFGPVAAQLCNRR